MMPNRTIEADINAAARIIGDISTGIYRSPANALKELVSNSFDAGATEVLINTDPPSFSNLTCYDNGPGISTEHLQTVLSYIGGSDKRLNNEVGTFGRPLIGKLGIGILAMSQISKQFVIISSKEGEEYRIEAEIDIEQFESSEASTTNLGDGKIGRYKIDHMPEEKEDHYTIITTPAGSEMLRTTLTGANSARDHFVTNNHDAENFREFIQTISDEKQRPTLGEYEKFLWELSALCPVPYFDDGPVRNWDDWNNVKKRLIDYNFTVIVDGYELRKPILLPTSDTLVKVGDDYAVYPFQIEEKEGLGVEAVGYLFHQRQQLSPPGIQGVLLRLRNVGIKGYESDLLDYPVNVGPMIGGLTGEIYIDQGLEDALNIDRNSFNETHPHFIAVQNKLFEVLGLPKQRGITTDIRGRSRKRQEKLRDDRTLEELERLTRKLNRSTLQVWELSLNSSLDSPLTLDTTDHKILINVNHDTVPSKRSTHEEFFRLCLIARLSVEYGPPDGEKDPIVGWLRKL